MRRRVVLQLILAQVSFFACLFIAVVMTTQGFKHNHGLSFYGEHWSTSVPYGAGFLFCDFFLMRAANSLPDNVARCRRLSVLLDLLAALLLGVLLTPDTVDSFFNWSHNIAGASLFLYELSFSAWLAVRCYADWLVWTLIGLESAAAVLALLSDFHVVYYLSEGILVFQLIFSMLLVYAVARYLARLAVGAFAESSSQ